LEEFQEAETLLSGLQELEPQYYRIDTLAQLIPQLQ